MFTPKKMKFWMYIKIAQFLRVTRRKYVLYVQFTDE